MNKKAVLLKIMDVLLYFDFQRVHDTMVALDWEWHNEGVPEIETIKEAAKKMLLDCDRENLGGISSGGFAASIQDGIPSLEFVVAGYTAEDEE